MFVIKENTIITRLGQWRQRYKWDLASIDWKIPPLRCARATIAKPHKGSTASDGGLINNSDRVDSQRRIKSRIATLLLTGSGTVLCAVVGSMWQWGLAVSIFADPHALHRSKKFTSSSIAGAHLLNVGKRIGRDNSQFISKMHGDSYSVSWLHRWKSQA